MITKPNKENYAQFIQERNDRTQEFMNKYPKVITGRQVSENQLSVKMITNAGYVFNPTNDTLERP